MNKTSLRSNIHKLIDQIDNPNLLEEYYKEMKIIIQKSKVSAWDSLNEKQRREVILSYEESEDEGNLLDNDSVMDKYSDWL
ncbi:MAG: hypothetical protein JW894_06270 [Bacteroidales bacterium]|nr:hypothetical protein [Bacteroidales bacterium]